MIHRHRGAALILVLMVVSVLGLLSLQMGLTAKGHVARADRLQERTEMLLRLQSDQADLVFALLTEPWVTGRNRDTENLFAKAWNFRGEPFEVDGVRYTIQDQNGLFQVPQRGDPSDDFVRLLESVGIDSARARVILLALQAEQDPKFEAEGAAQKPVPWQSIEELRDLGGLSKAEFERLKPLLTLYPKTYFNPATAPEPVLATRFEGEILGSLRSQQLSDDLTADTFGRITGLGDDEFTIFYPGPAFRIDFGRSHRGLRVTDEITLVLRPYEAEAVQVWGRRQ